MTAQILWGTNHENVLEFDRLDIQASGRPNRAGSEQARPGGRGVEDAWTAGYDYQLTGDMRWMDPSLWSGPSGVRDWLDWAAEKNTFRYVPDAAFPDFWVDGVYLASPVDDKGVAGRLEPNEQRRLPVVFRNPTYDFSLARRGLFFEFGPGDDGLPPQLTHTRNGQAGYFNRMPYDVQDNPLTRFLAPAGVLRDRDYWSTTQRTAALEGALSTVNLCTQPEALDNAFWDFNESTVTPNIIHDPGRNQAADKLIDSTVNTFHTRSFDFTVTAGQVCAATLYIRAQELTKCAVYFSDSVAGADKVGTDVDIGAGTVTPFINGAGVHKASAKLRRVRGTATAGWYELRFSGQVNTSSTTVHFVLRLRNAAGTGTYAGTGTDGMYFWGIMVTKGSSTAASYLNGTRVPDSVSMVWPWKPQPMWVYLKFIELGSANEFQSEGPWRVGIATAAPKKFLRFDTFTGPPSNYRFTHQDGVAGVSASASGIPLIGDTVELLGLLNADGSVTMKQSINGAAETSAGPSSANALDPTWTDEVSKLPLDYSGLFFLAKSGRGVAVNTMALARVA